MKHRFNPLPSPSILRVPLAAILIVVIAFNFSVPPSRALAKNAPAENLSENAVFLAAASSEWTQEAHDAQRTGFIAEEPAEPWTLAWTFNGPDANGGTGNHIYNAPAEAHTVTGGSLIYAPAGSAGLFALRKSDGSRAWRFSSPSFNATPAYDPATGFLYAGGADGKLYKIDTNTGTVQLTYNAGSPINKAVTLVGSNVYILTDNGQLHKVSTNNMSRVWVYSAGSGTATPAAFSAKAGLVIFSTNDLYVHAVRDADGTAQWKVKPTSHAAQDPYTFAGYWPVVAEQHGIVFVRLNLGWDAMWSGNQQNGAYPSSNAEVRALLQANNGALENLFALNLSDGSKKFIPAVGYGGVEYRIDANNGLTLKSGPAPIVKVNGDGSEVAYIPFRSSQGGAPDGRWDMHMGEMVLDNNTISGLAAGDLRYIAFSNSYVNITDEQTPLTMAGNTLFHAHWGASDSTKIVDRSASKGLSATSPITTQSHPPVVRRAQPCSDFNPKTHATSCGLALVNDGRYWGGPAFWTYWNVVDPPTRDVAGGYSDGLMPRYTYASSGLIVVEGNGGELMVFRYNGSTPAPTPTTAPKTTATPAPLSPTATSTLAPTNTPDPLSLTATPTGAPTQAKPTSTQPPAQPTETQSPVIPTATQPPANPTPLPSSATSLVIDSYNDLKTACAVLKGSNVSDANGGRLTLAGSLSDDFNAASLNSTNWAKASINGSPYAPILRNSLLTVPGYGYVRSKTRYTRSAIEATVQFEKAPGQNIGFGMDTAGEKLFSFSTYYGDGNLYARVKNNGVEQLTNLGPIPSGMHRYRLYWYKIDTANDGVNFLIDGELKAKVKVSSAGASLWYLYLMNLGTGNMIVERVQVAPMYKSSGNYTSCVLDAGAGLTWKSVSWSISKPSGTSLSVKVRTSSNGTTWSAWSAISSGAAIKKTRFVQFYVGMATSNTKNTPVLNSITLKKSVPIIPTVVSATRTPAPLAPTSTATGKPAPTSTLDE